MSLYVHSPQVRTPESRITLNWDELEVGQAIVLRSKGGVTHRGVVDAVTYDGRIIWLVPEWPASRCMIHSDDAVGVWKQLES